MPTNNPSENNQAFYYQIKGKNGEGYGNWTFPPIYSGRVFAANKKAAREIINEEYSRVFPLRVLNRDIDSNEYLLSINEILPGSHYEQLFELKACDTCGGTFYPIDKYNDHNVRNKSFQFCSDRCASDYYHVRAFRQKEFIDASGSSSPIIYKIHNRHTGMVYIGKTTQVFTLRWYQHVFHKGKCKFHKALEESKVSDWIFEVKECIEIPETIKTKDEIEQLILERERHWINHYNSIDNGYNSRT